MDEPRPPRPVVDPARLAALRETRLLDSPPEEAFDRLTRLVARLLRVPVSLVSLVDEDRQFFKSCHGLVEPWASARQTPLSHSFCQYVVAQDEPLAIEDARADPRLRDNLAIPDLGVVAYAGFPLRTEEGDVLGSLCAIDTQPREWSPEDLGALRDLAAAAVTEIELRAALRRQADAIAEVRAAREQAETVATTLERLQVLTDAALAHLTLDDLLHELVSRVQSVLDADTTAILLADSPRAGVRMRAAVGIDVSAGLTVPFGAGFAGRVALERRPRRVADIDTIEIVDPAVRESNVRSLLGVPLLVGRRVVGVLHVGSHTRREWTDLDEDLLQLVADRAALAIDHARLYERERRIADTLQRAMLPGAVPQLPGVSVAVGYLAAENDVGGDWYDVFPLPDGKVGVVIGDVVGRGVEAAATMAQVRNALRGFALEGHSPGTVFCRLDRLVEQVEGARMTTVVYAVADPPAGTLTYARAGHLPVLLRRADGTAEFLADATGPPLGVGRGDPWPEARQRLEPGALLLLFTDGVIERRDESIDRGLDRLRRAVAEAPGEPRATVRHVLATLRPRGSHRDDVALLALALVA